MDRMPEPLEQLREERLKKLAKIRQAGIDPFPARLIGERTEIEKAKALSGSTFWVAGRLMALRKHGGLIFADLKDESGQIQLQFKEDLLGKEGFGFLDNLDIGDFLAALGEVGQTKAGEITVFVSEYQFLAKAVRPLPSTWHGLKDVQERYRKRYLDLLINPETRRLLDLRWQIERETREFLWKEGFTEVETPVFQSLYGGTNAQPFTTHMNALDTDFYLRIAPELYLKRLVVGGYEKIFEIARNFRNEGLDTTHQPEFTMIEWYEAFADYHRIMETTEALTRHLVTKLYGGTKLTVNGQAIDLSGKWPRMPMADLIKKYLQLDVEKASDDELKEVLRENKIELVGKYSRGKSIFAVFEHLVTDKLIEPIWVIDYPIEVCPLQKRSREDERYAERFEGYIGGIEYADGWTEINDPIEQRKRFETEQRYLREGDEQAHPLDEDFIEALEYGMPPLGGIGIGIDRLVMFLTDTWSIRKVIAFPTLRPKR